MSEILFALERRAPAFGRAVRKLWESGDRGVGEFVTGLEHEIEDRAASGAEDFAWENMRGLAAQIARECELWEKLNPIANYIRAALKANDDPADIIFEAFTGLSRPEKDG